MRAYTNTRRFLAPIETITGKVQWIGIIVLAVMIVMAILAPYIAGFLPDTEVCDPFAEPSSTHILGCDDAGHDLLSQLLFGARISLFVGLSVAAFSTFIAVVLAIIAGFSGGWLDKLIMRIVDIVLSLPFLPLVIVLGVVLGASLITQIIVISIVMWAQPVRELRSQILSIRSFGFVEASRSMGANGRYIGVHHILPELAPLIVPQFVRIAHSAILIETSLSFLGLGDPTQTSWGTILYHANVRTAFLTGSWVYWIVPAGLAVSLTVTALAFIGFGYDASLSHRIAKRKQKQRIPKAEKAPDASKALSIRELQVVYHSELGETKAVQGVDLDLENGELLGLVGESGSGKTTVALAVLRLLRSSAQVTNGEILLQGQSILDINDESVRKLRGKKLALIPQSAMNALNPVMNIGVQIAESLDRGKRLNSKEKKEEIVKWLQRVGLEPKHAKSYPHELSGGMRQRAVIAIAICNTPDIVIADEPTTGLDVLVQEEIMELLLYLRQSLNLSILFVTHNLPLIARHADCLAVMYEGEIVDSGSVEQLLTMPTHKHTRDLFKSLPKIDEQKRWANSSVLAKSSIVSLKNISKLFHNYNALGLKVGSPHHALKNICLELHAGEKLGLVGGSGAGKSTIALIIMGMTYVDSGEVRFNNKILNNRKDYQQLSKVVHMVFQDPYQSMRNSMSIRDVVAEPLRIRGISDMEEMEVRVKEALERVHLPNDGDFISRLPVALSGGQRQRVAFARAIISNPLVIIADEPTSMLDQSIRMEIMELMEDLRLGLGTAFLFITHDIVLARHFCDRIVVLKDGEIVEQGEADSLISSPVHSYTQALIGAAS
ncbi:MAG: ATP-binding cassette domain-containing protein [Sulfurovum sp.]|nr:ATP-binding cassette domain-containing protein [Sulfurovum sp.]